MHVCQRIRMDLKKTPSLPHFTVPSNTEKFWTTWTMHAHAHRYTDTHTHNHPVPLCTHLWGTCRCFNTSDRGQGSSFETAENLTTPMGFPSQCHMGFHWTTSLGTQKFSNQISLFISDINFQEWNFHFANLKYVALFLLYSILKTCRNDHFIEGSWFKIGPSPKDLKCILWPLRVSVYI